MRGRGQLPPRPPRAHCASRAAARRMTKIAGPGACSMICVPRAVSGRRAGRAVAHHGKRGPVEGMRSIGIVHQTDLLDFAQRLGGFAAVLDEQARNQPPGRVEIHRGTGQWLASTVRPARRPREGPRTSPSSANSPPLVTPASRVAPMVALGRQVIN